MSNKLLITHNLIDNMTNAQIKQDIKDAKKIISEMKVNYLAHAASEYVRIQRACETVTGLIKRSEQELYINGILELCRTGK